MLSGLVLIWVWFASLSQAEVRQVPSLPGKAHSPPYLNETWGERDGLPGGGVKALWESNDGVLWVGCRHGLRIFDGKTFHIPEGLSELRDESIEQICSDGEGQIWISTGPVVYSMRLRADGVYEKHRSQGSHLLKDGLGWVWHKAGDEILGRQGTLQVRLPAEPPSRDPSVGLKLGLWARRDGGVYRADDQGDLWRGTPQGWTRIPGPLSPGERVNQCGIFEDRQRRIWFSIVTGTRQARLFIRNDGVWQRQTESDAALFLTGRSYHDTPGGSFLMGSDQGLIHHIREDGKARQVFKVFDYSEPVEAVHEDHLGNWWVGGEISGLRLISRDPVRLLTLHQDPPSASRAFQGPPAVENIDRRQVFPIRNVASDRQGRLWVAAGPHGLLVCHGDRLQAFDGAAPEVSGLAHIGVLAESSRGLVVGGQGLLLVLDGDGRVLPSQDHSAKTLRRRVISMAVDETGGIWAGLNSGGLLHVPADGSPSSLIPTEGQVFDVATQRDRVWVVDGKRLRCRSKNRWEPTPEALDQIGTPHSVCVNRRGWLLVVGDSQVAIRSDQHMVVLGRQQGFFPRLSSKWFEDRQSNLWLATDDGCLEVDPKWLNEQFSHPRGRSESKIDAEVIRRVVHFSSLSDIRLSSHHSARPCLLPSGEVALPSNLGVAVLGLEAPDNPAWRPQVRIREVKAGAHGLFGELVSMPDQVIPEGAHLLLGLQRNLDATLRPPLVRCSPEPGPPVWIYSWDGEPIDFTASVQRVNLFHDKVRLAGSDRGDLGFRIQTKGSGGVWTEQPVTRFKVDLNPWRARLWRNLAFAALVAMVGVVSWHVYRTTLQKRQLRIRALEGIQEDRLRLGRSLHDDLGNRLSEIQFLVEQVKTVSDPGASARSTIDRIQGRCFEAVESLDRMVWLLKEVPESADDLGRHLELMARNYLEVCGVRFEFQMVAGRQQEVSGWVRQLLIAATQELARNAVKHGRATELEMRLRVSDDSVSLRVEDNGLGFDVKSATVSGRGLSSILRRVDDFGGCSSVVSRPGCSVILIQVPRTAA